MIKSVLCVDCICLAVCMNKTTTAIIGDCDLFENTLDNISASVQRGDSLFVYFKALDKKIHVRVSDADHATVFIEIDDRPSHRHILSWR
jgi:hypothetical protein